MWLYTSIEKKAGKKYISTPMKFYFTDCGLRNVRINFRQYEETHIMENIIYNELNYCKGWTYALQRIGNFDIESV